MTHISEQMMNILHEERLAKAEHARLVRSYEHDRLTRRRWSPSGKRSWFSVLRL